MQAVYHHEKDEGRTAEKAEYGHLPVRRFPIESVMMDGTCVGHNWFYAVNNMEVS